MQIWFGAPYRLKQPIESKHRTEFNESGNELNVVVVGIGIDWQ